MYINKFFIIKKINKFIILLFFFTPILLLSFIYKFYKLKIALCTMGKLENLYVKEFILYYKKLGIDKIFIYDDNDINSEKINDVNPLKNYAIVYEKIKDRIKNHSDAYTDCYNNNKNKYNWFLMIDMDEYLIIVNDTLKKYLSNPIFNKCDFIKFHWMIPTDNNLLYYDNRTLFERFKGPYKKSIYVKTIIKGGINNLIFNCHSPLQSPERNISCSNVGKVLRSKRIDKKKYRPINIEKAYIIHYKFKSTEEFINKYKRGYSNWHKNKTKHLLKKLNNYLKYNKRTKKKLRYIEYKLKINLSKYYKKRNKKNKKL